RDPRQAAALLLTVAGLWASSPVWAQAEPPLALAVQGCAQTDQARLRELVSIEVRTVGADAPPRRTTVRLTCSEDQIDIQVPDDLTSNASRSQLNLGGVPEATRLRLLAVTITELVAVSWREPRAA